MSSSFSEEKSEEFFYAARDGNLDLVKSLSVDPEVDLNWQDRDGCSPFWWACCNGHVDVVRYLLDFHDHHPREPVDFNLADYNYGCTPFSVACSYGQERVVEVLLENDKIHVNRATNIEENPLWEASCWGYLGVVKRLLASTREIDVLNEDKEWKKTAAKIVRHIRKKGIAALIEAYQKDPECVRKQLRRELGLDVRLAGELFALVVYLSDGYLIFTPEHQGHKEQRFLSIATRLPMELQMVLCNQAFGVPNSIVKQTDSERGFRKFARA